MNTLWIEGRTVMLMSLHRDLVLTFDNENELVINAPFRLTLPPLGNEFPSEDVLIDPHRIADHERPLLNLAGTECTGAEYRDDGALRLDFANGLRIAVATDPAGTAWELYGKRHGFAACLADGRVHVVRHDIPQPAGAADVPRT